MAKKGMRPEGETLTDEGARKILILGAKMPINCW